MEDPTNPDRHAATDWLEANRQAIILINDWVEAHGLPLADRRLF